MRKTTGTNVAPRLFLLCGFLLASLLGAAGKKPVEAAVIAGTVFQEPGFALPRAEVTLAVKTPPQGAKPPRPQKMAVNGRGEFFFRVPPLKADYILTARAPGFRAEQRLAAISGGPERLEIYITLKPESQQGK
ncbi:MAG: carboxypeptidase regulatory-like domain-containing protein [Candidatus Solibacter usitatus]|nr:carboxypeptidase regulatory-like domain-containing protein [Candidatus Solibacter usitatus]